MARSETEGKRSDPPPSSEAVKIPRHEILLKGSEGIKRNLTHEEQRDLLRARREEALIGRRQESGMVAVDSGLTFYDEMTRFREDVFKVEETERGYNLIVAITDVSAVIPKNSQLDKIAQRRRDESSGPLFDNIFRGELGLNGEPKPTVSMVQRFDKQYNALGDPEFELTYVQLKREEELMDKDVRKILRNSDHEMFPFFARAANMAVNLRDKEGIPVSNVRRKEDGTLELVSFDNAALPAMMVGAFMGVYNDAAAFYIEGSPALFKGQKKYLPDDARWDPYFYTSNPDILDHAELEVTLPMREHRSLIDQRVLTKKISGEPAPYSHIDIHRLSKRYNKPIVVEGGMQDLYGNGIPLEVPKAETKVQRYRKRLEENYDEEGLRQLRMRTARKMANNERLVGDEKLAWKIMDAEAKEREESDTRKVFKKIRNMGVDGKRIEVRKKVRPPREKEVFPANQETGPCIVTISKLNDFDGKEVTVEALIEQGLVDERARKDGVKIHAIGNLKTEKALDIVGIAITDNAAAKIIARKGTLQDVPPSERDLRRKKQESIRRDERSKKLIEEWEKEPWVFPFSHILRREKALGLSPHGKVQGPSQIPVDVNLLGRWYGPSELPFWEALIDEKTAGIYPHGDVQGPSQIPDEIMRDYYVKRDLFLANAGSEKVKIPLPKKDRIFPSRKRERRVVSLIQSTEKQNGIYREGAQYEVVAYGPSELGFWDLFNKEKRRGIKPGSAQSEISRKMMDNYYTPRVDPAGPWQLWGGFLKYQNSPPSTEV